MQVNINYPEFIDQKCKENKISSSKSEASIEIGEVVQYEEVEDNMPESSEENEFDGKGAEAIEKKDADVLADMMDLKDENIIQEHGIKDEPRVW